MNYQEVIDLLRIEIQEECNKTFRNTDLLIDNMDVWFERQKTLSYVLGLIDTVEARVQMQYTHK